MISVKSIKTKHQQLCNCINGKKIKDGLDILNDLVAETGYNDFFVQISYIETTYEQMLKYTLEGVQDPERDKIYMNLQRSIIELSDKVKAQLYRKYSGWHSLILQSDLEKKQKLTGKGVIESLDDLAFSLELDEIVNKNKTTPKSNDLKRRAVIMEIFKHLWLTNEYGDAENSLVDALISCSDFTWYEQAIQVSSILLSGLRHFDENKIHRLMDFVEMEEQQVAARALVALVIMLNNYNDRIYLYPSIESRLELMKDVKNLDKQMEQIIIQLIRTEDTLELGKKLHEDIIPEISKLQPDLEEKLKMEDLKAEDLLNEKNPEWQNMFQESDELYKKVDEFMKLQMEGADVYMTTFAQLKNFPFFNELTNWLVPFYEENPDLAEIYAQESDSFKAEAFISGLKKMPFLCNSDKYSFLFNLRFLPNEQKKMLGTAFTMELESMSEMISDDELLHPDFARRLVFVQYIQDLYRFFKISPFKNEFEDVFKSKLKLQNQVFVEKMVDDIAIFRNIAEYYFEKGHYEEALLIFQRELVHSPDEIELVEKAAFCYQKMEHYQEAIKLYERILDREKISSWTVRNMGVCFRKLKNYSDALSLYQRALLKNPDDVRLETLIGYCNMKLEDYDTALKHYFKIEYMNPENTAVLRPIAWSYFMSGEYEKAARYYEKVFNLKPDYYDYVNHGHLKWVMGDRPAAVDNYILSTNYGNYSFSDLQKTIDEDSPALIQKGIDKDEISLVLDYLRYKV